MLSVALVLAILLAAVAGGSGRNVSPTGGTARKSIAGDKYKVSAAEFSMRGLRCYAPPFTGSSPNAATRGLVRYGFCSWQYALSEENHHIQPARLDNGVPGYTVNIGADPIDATAPSTSPADDIGSLPVILLGPPASGNVRLVLTAALVTAKDIRSAVAVDMGSKWSVRLQMTYNGSVSLANLVSTTFHGLAAVVLQGRVINTALVESTDSSYSPVLNGEWTISGLTEHQAEAIAALL